MKKYIMQFFRFSKKILIFLLQTMIVRKSYKKNIGEKKYIYIDTTEFFLNDVGTGIQRVVKKVVEEIKKIETSYEVKEIYINGYKGYYTCAEKSKVVFSNQDIFLGLDLIFYRYKQVKRYLDYAYKKEMKIYFFVYDLIPILIKEENSFETAKQFESWLTWILKFTGIITDSAAVIGDIKEWISKNPEVKINPNIEFSYTHLGADFERNHNFETTVSRKETFEFLMVSTLMYRKKVDDIVNAFEILWDKNHDVVLNIVGRPNYAPYTELIRNSKNYNKKLFWFNNGISDKELIQLYKDCDAVIFASIAEGFGLSLIEASYYKKPLIIRDIPVFREVMGDKAFYFSGNNSEVLATRIIEWINLYKENKHPKSNIKALSWRECAINVFNIITKE